jgi:hypothetical protein
MALDGTWNIEISSPMGAQKATIEIKVDGGVITGVQKAAQGEAPIENGKAEGDRGTWALNVTTPMPMKLEFDVTAAGDTLAGTVKAGAFGQFPVKGVRA